MKKWKPTKAQRAEFALRMSEDAEYREAYYARKMQRAKNRRNSSKYDYNTAGGCYVPTEAQNQAAFRLLMGGPTPEQENACHAVTYGYSCREKVHHDHIHIINEYIRKS